MKGLLNFNFLLLQRTTFHGKCYMTHATKAIYRWLLSDYIKVSNISSSEQNLYTEKELVDSMEKIDTMDFHSEKEVNGIKFWAYNAGHVLGAAMFMIEIAGEIKSNHLPNFFLCIPGLTITQFKDLRASPLVPHHVGTSDS